MMEEMQFCNTLLVKSTFCHREYLRTDGEWPWAWEVCDNNRIGRV